MYSHSLGAKTSGFIGEKKRQLKFVGLVITSVHCQPQAACFSGCVFNTFPQKCCICPHMFCGKSYQQFSVQTQSLSRLLSHLNFKSTFHSAQLVFISLTVFGLGQMTGIRFPTFINVKQSKFNHNIYNILKAYQLETISTQIAKFNQCNTI